MSEKPISPLRQRMLEDMSLRGFTPDTQRDYIRAVKKLAAFLDRSPDTATAKDLRAFQLHLTAGGVQPPTINATVTVLRFFFKVTLDRPETTRRLVFVYEPSKLPRVLSPEEVLRLLEAAPSPKHKAALSVAYGAGLRAAEVVSLKVCDIDSKRMIIRVEQGKGRKDRNVMLSPLLLDLLREWWRAARPRGWLFPGRDPAQPMTTRQLNRACHAAAQMAEIKKRVSLHTLRHSFATHLLEQNIDVRVIQVLLGHAKLDTTALYTRVATKTISEVMSPLEHIALKLKEIPPPGSRGARVAPGFGGCGYLPRPWPGMASSPCRPCQPRATEGDVGHRELQHSSPRRPCRALRGLRPYDDRLQLLPQPALPEVPGR